MTARIVYLNGEWMPESDAKVSIHDRGFMLADGAFDVVRTYRHELFRLDDHIDRLYGSLNYLRLNPSLERHQLTALCEAMLERNRRLLREDDEYWVTVRITRGINPPFYSEATRWNPPTVVVYCTPVRFETFAPAYREGMRLETSSIRRTPAACIDPRAKTHERLNLVLAHMEVAGRDATALPLMLDIEGYVSEAFTANIFLVSGDALQTPSTRVCLSGITRRVVLELADRLGIPACECDVTLYDVANADEAFVTATSFGIVPVHTIDGRPLLVAGTPGPVTKALTNAFSELVGVDIVQHARRVAGLEDGKQ